MNITTAFDFGDIVYLKTDTEQLERVVCQMKVLPGCIVYEVTCGTLTSSHYDFELTTQRDIMKQLNISSNEIL